MKNAKKGLRVNKIRLPLRSMVLAVFFLLGITFGYVFAMRTKAAVGEELLAYLERYAAFDKSVSLSATLVLETLCCYLKDIFAVLILGFSFAGVLLLPLLCAVQAFLFAFSFFSFSAALGQTHFFTVALLFGARFFLLPLTFWLAMAAMDKSLSLLALSFGSGKRIQPIRYDAEYWTRCSIVILAVLLAALLELWLPGKLISHFIF